jgi:molybdopterin converting factor subunit 1
VRLFARAKDLAGTDCLELELSAPLTVGDVRRALLRQLPALEPLAHSLLAAVDAEYANDDHPVPSRGEVAFFPPVSGG